MRKIAFSFIALVLTMAIPVTGVQAQQSCQPGMDYIVYQHDGPPPGGPIVGYYVVWCNGNSQLYGAWGTHEDIQWCGCPA
jgi:hypothetical protein